MQKLTEEEAAVDNQEDLAAEYLDSMGRIFDKPTISLSPEFLSRIDMIECRLSKLEWVLQNAKINT